MIQLRQATVDDAPTIASILCEAWLVAYRDIVTPDAMKDYTDLLKRTAKVTQCISEDGDAYVLACRDDVAVGMIAFGPAENASLGEIYACYALPEFWGKGVGAALMPCALDGLRAQGFHEVILWVFRDNPRARHFYEKQGFSHDGAEEEFCGAASVRYRRTL